MRKSLLRRPSPALVVAFVALLVALAGTSYAAFSIPKNSVGAKQLKNNAVTTGKIKNGAVTASKIKTSGLTVPNASFANSAGSATNATNAQNAVNAQTATVGGPIVFAAVNSNGTVDAAHSRGITSSQITESGTSSYCFSGLPSFTVALATPAYPTIGNSFGVTAMVSYRDFPSGDTFSSDCTASGDQLEVTTNNAGVGFAKEPFYVALYK